LADQIKGNEVGGECVTLGRGNKNMYRVLVGKTEGKGRWEDQGDQGMGGWYQNGP
jgi:hypothetical protein